METLYTASKKKKKKRPGADSGSDHEQLIEKFRLKFKKVGKTSRPFRFDLNHIPYDYTVEVTNRFKGFDLTECLKNYWTEFSPVVQRVKRLPTVWETQVQSLGREVPLEKEMATHSSILAWRIPWMEEPGGLQSWGRKESDMTERAHFMS